MVQFYSTDGKYSFYENFANDETKLKELQENIKLAKDELEIAKSNTYKVLQQKQNSNSNLEKINKELKTTITKLEVVISELEYRQEEAILNNTKAKKNKVDLEKQLTILSKNLDKSILKLNHEKENYKKILTKYNLANENKLMIDDLIKNHQLKTNELEALIIKEKNDVDILIKQKDNASDNVNSKEKALVTAIAEVKKAKADKDVISIKLDKENNEYQKMDKTISKLREKVIQAHNNLSEKTLYLEILNGSLDESAAKLEKSKIDNNKIISMKKLKQADIEEYKLIKESQEKELILIEKKQKSLDAYKELLIAKKNKFESDYNSTEEQHNSALEYEKVASDNYNNSLNSLNNLEIKKDILLENNIINSIESQLSSDKKDDKINDLEILKQKQKLEIAEKNEKEAVIGRKIEQDKLNKLDVVEKFTDIYEYNKGEDCTISIITILLIIILSGYLTGIIKRK
jgi:hypothetical protein